jgi:hypothetical protein
MKIEYCIPTLNRPKELKRLQASLPPGGVVSVKQETKPRALPRIVNELLAESTGDVMFLLADHLVLQPGCVDEVVRLFNEHFPDTDGVVGLKIEGEDFPYAFPVVGRKYLERFMGRRLYCPHYHHFHADTECGKTAERLGRFVHAKKARVVSHHPKYGTAPKDETWKASRVNQRKDNKLLEAREARGELWGMHEAAVYHASEGALIPEYRDANISTGVGPEVKRVFGADGIHWSCLGCKGEVKLGYFARRALDSVNSATPTILEIGTHRGVSSTILAKCGFRVITYDVKLWPLQEKVWEHFKVRDQIDARLVKNNLRLAQELEGLEFDAAFIDGDHSYKAVLENFAAGRKCGRVIFHDYGPVNFLERVVKVVDEIRTGVTHKCIPYAYWESAEIAGLPYEG